MSVAFQRSPAQRRSSRASVWRVQVAGKCISTSKPAIALFTVKGLLPQMKFLVALQIMDPSKGEVTHRTHMRLRAQVNKFMRYHVVFSGEALIADLAEELLFLLRELGVLIDEVDSAVFFVSVLLVFLVASGINIRRSWLVQHSRGSTGVGEGFVRVACFVRGVVRQLSAAKFLTFMDWVQRVLHL